MSKQKQNEEIKDNDLVSYLEEQFGHLKPYWSHIALGACIVLGAILAMMYFWDQARLAEAEKWQRLSDAQLINQLQQDSDSLQEVAESFPDDKAGLWALLFAADSEVRSGLSDLFTDRNKGFDKIKKGQTYYQKILDSSADKSTMLQRRATYGLAYALESTGDFTQAAEKYQELVDLGEDSPFAEYSRRGLERSNNPEMAKLFEHFRSYEPPMDEAPGINLPKRPDITFPEVGENQPDSGGGDFGTDDSQDSEVATVGESETEQASEESGG